MLRLTTEPKRGTQMSYGIWRLSKPAPAQAFRKSAGRNPEPMERCFDGVDERPGD
jgi:hypothetical protein